PEITARDKALSIIEGKVPRLDQNFTECRFLSRCDKAFEACHKIYPDFVKVAGYGQVKCHWYDGNILKQYHKEPLEHTVIKKNTNNIFANEMENEDDVLILNTQQLKVHFPIKAGFFKKTVGHV